MIASPSKKFVKNPIYISYTSLSDFLNCPRAYYFRNIYRDPKTGHRVQIASPYLSLGSTVHDALKWFLDMKGQVGYDQLEQTFRNYWLKYRGKKGGFGSVEEEAGFGKRGLQMIANFFKNASVLGKAAPGLSFPKFHLGENLVLMGNLDYAEILPEGSLHVVDFKTGAKDEDDSLQLYIYGILAESNLERQVSAASFWYLDRDDKPRPVVLDALEPKLKWIQEKAFEIKQAIEKGQWVCVKKDPPAGGCRDCRDFERILGGEGEFQFFDERYKKDIYFLAG